MPQRWTCSPPPVTLLNGDDNHRNRVNLNENHVRYAPHTNEAIVQQPMQSFAPPVFNRNRTNINNINNNNNNNNFFFNFSPSSSSQNYIAMDCEMVGVGFDGLDSMLARVTIIDWNNHILLDKYVQPYQTVVDYRTHVSGITAAHLQSKDAINYSVCRAAVWSILQGKILVGHGLRNDLEALKIAHPWYLIRDTALYEPFMKVRFNDGILWPRKLKELCHEFLGKVEIQPLGRPHSSAEDALAALELYKSVQQHWEGVVRYQVMQSTMKMERQIQCQQLRHQHFQQKLLQQHQLYYQQQAHLQKLYQLHNCTNQMSLSPPSPIPQNHVFVVAPQ